MSTDSGFVDFKFKYKIELGELTSYSKPKTNVDIKDYLEDVKLRPMISFRFDDGRNTDYLTAHPLLKERGLKGTFYIITNNLGGNSSLSVDDLYEMSKYGHEIGTHTHTHRRLTTLTDEEIINEMSTSISIIENITNKKVTSMSPPGHNYDERVDRLVHGFVEFVNVAGHQDNNNFNKYGTLRNTTTLRMSNTPITTLKRYVDEAIEGGYWLVLHTHRVVNDKTPQSGDINIDVFIELLDYVNSKRPHEIDNVTISEGANRIRQQIDPSLESIDGFYQYSKGW